MECKTCEERPSVTGKKYKDMETFMEQVCTVTCPDDYKEKTAKFISEAQPVVIPLTKDTMFIHSKCCNDHWELAYNTSTGKYDLSCVKCGRLIGGGIFIDGPFLQDVKCNCENCEQGCDQGEQKH